mmetsp:Transcript_11407/g.17303  ORF Transcript_11407/g.17303 Transcript_11407/m.17303 type:complete len:111 (-) Transcript_11407:1208-1540(-)
MTSTTQHGKQVCQTLKHPDRPQMLYGKVLLRFFSLCHHLLIFLSSTCIELRAFKPSSSAAAIISLALEMHKASLEPSSGASRRFTSDKTDESSANVVISFAVGMGSDSKL